MKGQNSGRAGTALIITAGCLLYMISGGIRCSFGVAVPALADRTGLSYAQVSFAVAVGQLMYGATQPLFGVLALRRSNGEVLLLGTLLMAAGLSLTAAVTTAVGLTLSVGLLFFSGTGALSYGIIMGAISPALGERRASAASGVLNASSGIGSSLLSPLMQSLCARLGVAGTMLALCVPVLILLPVCLWLARLSAPGAPAGEKADTGALTRLRQALADPDYRRLMLGFGTCGFHMCIVQTHIFSQIVSYGIAERTASLAYTVFGLTGMAGAMLCGVLCQRLELKGVLGTLYAVRAAAVAVFLFLLPKTAAAVFAFVVVLGLTGDATVTPTSQLISRRFGAEGLGFLFGVTFVCHQIGGFLSAWAGGVLISASGNYTAIWGADILLCALAAAVSWRIRRERA